MIRKISDENQLKVELIKLLAESEDLGLLQELYVQLMYQKSGDDKLPRKAMDLLKKGLTEMKNGQGHSHAVIKETIEKKFNR